MEVNITPIPMDKLLTITKVFLRTLNKRNFYSDDRSAFPVRFSKFHKSDDEKSFREDTVLLSPLHGRPTDHFATDRISSDSRRSTRVNYYSKKRRCRRKKSSTYKCMNKCFRAKTVVFKRTFGRNKRTDYDGRAKRYRNVDKVYDHRAQADTKMKEELAGAIASDQSCSRSGLNGRAPYSNGLAKKVKQSLVTRNSLPFPATPVYSFEMDDTLLYERNIRQLIYNLRTSHHSPPSLVVIEDRAEKSTTVSRTDEDVYDENDDKSYGRKQEKSLEARNTTSENLVPQCEPQICCDNYGNVVEVELSERYPRTADNSSSDQVGIVEQQIITTTNECYLNEQMIVAALKKLQSIHTDYLFLYPEFTDLMIKQQQQTISHLSGLLKFAQADSYAAVFFVIRTPNYVLLSGLERMHSSLLVYVKQLKGFFHFDSIYCRNKLTAVNLVVSGGGCGQYFGTNRFVEVPSKQQEPNADSALYAMENTIKLIFVIRLTMLPLTTDDDNHDYSLMMNVKRLNCYPELVRGFVLEQYSVSRIE